MDSARPSSVGEEELQLQLALAMSKEEHEEEVRKHMSDELKLQMAIEQSRNSDGSQVWTNYVVLVFGTVYIWYVYMVCKVWYGMYGMVCIYGM